MANIPESMCVCACAYLIGSCIGGIVQIYTNPQGGTQIYFTALIVIKFITYNERRA